MYGVTFQTNNNNYDKRTRSHGETELKANKTGRVRMKKRRENRENGRVNANKEEERKEKEEGGCWGCHFCLDAVDSTRTKHRKDIFDRRESCACIEPHSSRLSFFIFFFG